MAEPFLLRPWEIERLTDGQIKMMIDAQKRMTDTVSVKGEGESEFAEPVQAIIGDGDFVTAEQAAAFMSSVSKQVNQL